MKLKGISISLLKLAGILILIQLYSLCLLQSCSKWGKCAAEYQFHESNLNYPNTNTKCTVVFLGAPSFSFPSAFSVGILPLYISNLDFIAAVIPSSTLIYVDAVSRYASPSLSCSTTVLEYAEEDGFSSVFFRMARVKGCWLINLDQPPYLDEVYPRAPRVSAAVPLVRAAPLLRVIPIGPRGILINLPSSESQRYVHAALQKLLPLV
jgi:hypothetical protein